MPARPKAIRLTDPQRFDWLRLIRSENVGPRTFGALIKIYGSAGAALGALPGLARRGGAARQIRIATPDEVERELKAAREAGVRFVALGEPEYPAALRQIDSAPPILALRGREEALQQPAVAIVGSRNASAAGLTFADRLARGLGAAGYVIVSGLARGVDQRAHTASLATGTIGVLAGGHARPYPPEAAPLIARIVEFGAVISEMPIEWEVRGRDFPRRNRIVSGLALGTVIVEAARNSGSLITARFAAEQNREVFAVPGSPLDPRAEGANDLLRDGATLCARPEDVLSVLEPLRARAPFAILREGARDGTEALSGEQALLDFDRDGSPVAGPGDAFGAESSRSGGARTAARAARAHRRSARPVADFHRRTGARRRSADQRSADRAAGARSGRPVGTFGRRPGQPDGPTRAGLDRRAVDAPARDRFAFGVGHVEEVGEQIELGGARHRRELSSNLSDITGHVDRRIGRFVARRRPRRGARGRWRAAPLALAPWPDRPRGHPSSRRIRESSQPTDRLSNNDNTRFTCLKPRSFNYSRNQDTTFDGDDKMSAPIAASRSRAPCRM